KVAVVVEVDLVDQPQFVDVDRDLGVVDRLQDPDKVLGDTGDFGLRQTAPVFGLHARRLRLGGGSGGVIGHAKNVLAFSIPWTSASTSSLPLYRAIEARHVEVTPNRLSNGMAQWVPARTAIP